MDRVRREIGIDNVMTRNLKLSPVGIGVLDSGVFLHDDIRLGVMGFKDFVHYRKRPYDDSGHGTHVCGIIAGSGQNSQGRYSGIAPFSKLYVSKILDSKGGGSVYALLKALDWILTLKSEVPIHVINISISLVHFNREKDFDNLMELFQYAFQNNIIPVVSAGNNGPDHYTISRIGDSKYCICVGCYDFPRNGKKADLCQEYSARGPGNLVYEKPDLVAPGSQVISLDKYKGRYIKKSGTSMATAVVSGVIAYGFASFPQISSYDIKRELLLSTQKADADSSLLGYGIVNGRNFISRLKDIYEN